MKIEDIKKCCYEFYRKFSALDLQHLQLKFTEREDSASIVLMGKNEHEEIEAAIHISQDTVFLVKINCFDDIDVSFIFDTELELYCNLLTLLILCCYASQIKISILEALSVTLTRKIRTWRDIVKFLCSLTPKDKAPIVVRENHQNALKFLNTTLLVKDGFFIADGLFKTHVEYKELLALVHAVLEAVSAVFKIYNYEVNPFFELEDPGRL